MLGPESVGDQFGVKLAVLAKAIDPVGQPSHQLSTKQVAPSHRRDLGEVRTRADPSGRSAGLQLKI